MENGKKIGAKMKKLTVAGKEVSVHVHPRTVMMGDKEQVVHKTRITTPESLTTVEEVIGRNNMVHRDMASYSRRETDAEAVQAVLDGSGDAALVSALPEQHLGEESPLVLLATIDSAGTLPPSTFHLIGRKEIPLVTTEHPTV